MLTDHPFAWLAFACFLIVGLTVCAARFFFRDETDWTPDRDG